MEEIKKEYKWMRNTARVLIGVWTAFWLFFGIASSIGEKMINDMVVVSIIVLIPAVITWWKEKIGGWLLLIIGLVVLIGYLFVMHFLLKYLILNDLMLSFCPLVAGLLIILRTRKLKEQII